VIKRINYFRRLVGLNDNTTLDVSQFEKYQETALMMKVNGKTNHFPPDTWTCWTENGYDGATKSNLVLSHSTTAITNFIKDPGASNVDVGHRRWILHSPKTQFSYGTTNTSMALGVIGVTEGNTQIPQFIADADFSSANVTMSGPNGNISLAVVSTTLANVGDNTIVWEPLEIITNSTNDVSYTVDVSGVANAPQSSYNYTVTIIKP